MSFASKIIMTQGDEPLKPLTGTIAIYAKPDNKIYTKDDNDVEMTLATITERTLSSPTASGNVGDVCWDSSYIYICIATDTWKRATISTWS